MTGAEDESKRRSSGSHRNFVDKRVWELEGYHSGFHVSGWKSDMDRQSLDPVVKRPLGVSIIIPGACRVSSTGKPITVLQSEYTASSIKY